MAITKDEKIFLFGGFDKYTDEGKSQQQLFVSGLTWIVESVVRILDLRTGTWEKFPTVDVTTEKPSLGMSSTVFCYISNNSALTGHTSVAKEETIVIFGGESEEHPWTNDLYLYHMHQNKWTVLNATGQEPPARTRHASCLSPDGRRMYISGGMINGKDVAKDLYWYEFETQRWNGPLEFVSRYGHTITLYNNKIWAFGGLTPDMDRVSELAWYDLETDAIGKVSITSMEDPYRLSLNAYGHHIYGSGVTGTMLDVVTAGPTTRNVETSISALDLNTLKIRSIISDCSKYFEGYTWHHMLTLGSRLILLGQPGSADDDGRLSHIFSLDLAEFGYLESSQARNDAQSPTGTIAHDMFEFFNRSELCDFEITAVEGNERPPLFHNMANGYQEEDSQDTIGDIQNHRFRPHMSSPLASESEPNLLSREPSSSLYRQSSAMNLDRSQSVNSNRSNSLISEHSDSNRMEDSDLPTFTVSSPIKVHMMVLFARWPHFSRIMSSQMTEFHNRKLYIPEPVAWVRKLVEFMYRDSIDGCTIEEAAGLLILANLYELPRLRTLCIECISKLGITDNNAVIVWHRAMEADEEVIRRNAAFHCFRHWGQIVRSPAFHNLSKEAMIALCEEADTNAFVTSYTPTPEQTEHAYDDDEPKDEGMPSSTTGVDESDGVYDAYAEDMDMWN